MMTFYHGTTDIFNIKKILLPPTYTNNLREEWRKKYQNMVFFTTSLLSASKFARKACDKYGGNPIVYEVKPIGQYFNTIYGEYISERALVVGIKWQDKSNNVCVERGVLYKKRRKTAH